MSDRRQRLQLGFDKVWREGDLDGIEYLMVPGAQTSGILTEGPVTVNEMKDLVNALSRIVADMSVDVRVFVEQGDWISALLEVRAHVRDSGDPIHAFGQMMARFDGNRMIEVYHSFDFLSFFEQTGQLPEDATALLLSGARLH